MKTFVCLLLSVSVMLCWMTNCAAKDYKSAHKVKPGDVISADVINELFDEIENFRKTLTEDDLIGTWKGESYGVFDTPGWQPGPGSVTNYYVQTNVTVAVTKEGDKYRMVTSAPNPFDLGVSGGVDIYFSIKAGMLFSTTYPFPRIIDRISSTRIRIMTASTFNSGMFVRPGPAYMVVLDKQETTPEPPGLISADVSDTSVVLTWDDSSVDASGFLVYRKDRVSEVYSNVCYVSSNVTCWTNVGVPSGYYWYRIAATNQYGLSIGSNVKKVVVP